MNALTYLSALIQGRSGIVVGPDKQYLLEARLAPIMRREALRDLDHLVRRLAKADCEELERDITEAVATHETLFFRDSKPFEHLRTVGLPALLRHRPIGTKLRIWSAAASTGQETYSIAMILAESGLASRRRAEIIGTDLAKAPIERAREGVFTQYEVQRGLSVQHLLRYFTREGQHWRVNAGLRAQCRFQQWNLLDDPAPLGRFDVVFCRNVLFYLDRAVRAQVLRHIRERMAPDGLLYIGAAESAAGLDDELERHGPAYRLRDGGPPPYQYIAPRAVTGQRHSTTPSRTPTYQS